MERDIVRHTSELPESTQATIAANAKKWAARPMPDHIVLALSKILNSVERKP